LAGVMGDVLDLRALREGAGGLTPEVGASLAQAAAVCLDDRGHAPGATVLQVTGTQAREFALAWDMSSEQARRCWADLAEAVEYAATGVALSLVREMTGQHVVERAVIGTGFDYWLGDPAGDPFQRKARFEVSGILNGNSSLIDQRVKIKRNQVAGSASQLPVHVVVVEFGQPAAVAELGRPVAPV
jgi:hypothetical protein